MVLLIVAVNRHSHSELGANALAESTSASASSTALGAPSIEALGKSELHNSATPPAENMAGPSTAFAKQRLCIVAARGKKFFAENPDQRKWLVDKEAAFKGLSDAQRRERGSLLDSYERMADAVEQGKFECAGMDKSLEDGSIYANALTAAKLGDKAAADCYVSLGLPMPDSMKADKAQLAQYQRNAGSLIQAGIKHGDWTMVLLATQAENPRDPTWLRALGTNDPAVTFRLLTLQSLGAANVSVRDQFKSLADGLEQHVPPEQVAGAKAWARDTYATSFSKSPPLNPDITFCP
jgi:hypothetical protein